jgi:hypothetical protein
MEELKTIIIEGSEEELKEVLALLQSKNIAYIKKGEKKYLSTLLAKTEEQEDSLNQPIIKSEKFLSDAIFYGTKLEKMANESKLNYSIFSDGDADIKYVSDDNRSILNDNIFNLPNPKHYRKVDKTISQIMEWDELNLNTITLRNGDDYIVSEITNLTKIKTIEMGK